MWEFADLANDTAKGLREHFERVGFGEPIMLSEGHWHLIVLALERAAKLED